MDFEDRHNNYEKEIEINEDLHQLIRHQAPRIEQVQSFMEETNSSR